MRFEGIGEKLEAGIGFEPMYMGIVGTHVFDRFTTPPLVLTRQWSDGPDSKSTTVLCPVTYGLWKSYPKVTCQVTKKAPLKKNPPLKVKKEEFDRVLGKLIQSPPVQRNQAKNS